MDHVWVLEYVLDYDYEGKQSEVVGVFSEKGIAQAAIIEHVKHDEWKTNQEGQSYSAPGTPSFAEWILYKCSFNTWEYPTIALEGDL